jgi:hypothetical protein
MRERKKERRERERKRKRKKEKDRERQRKDRDREERERERGEREESVYMYAHATWPTCGLCGTALVPTQRNSPSSCASSDGVRLLAIAAKRDAAKRECSRSSLATCNSTSRTVQAIVCSPNKRSNKVWQVGGVQVQVNIFFFPSPIFISSDSSSTPPILISIFVYCSSRRLTKNLCFYVRDKARVKENTCIWVSV